MNHLKTAVKATANKGDKCATNPKKKKKKFALTSSVLSMPIAGRGTHQVPILYSGEIGI